MAAAQATTAVSTAEDYTATAIEEWNKRVDDDIQVLANGFRELVNGSGVAGKDMFGLAQETFSSEVHTQTMIKATTSLLSLSDSLKLLNLVKPSNSDGTSQERAALEKEIEMIKAEAEEEHRQLERQKAKSG